MKQQLFGEASEEIGDLFLGAKFDGILGMAFKAISINGITPVFQSMIEQNLITTPVFGFWLNRYHFEWALWKHEMVGICGKGIESLEEWSRQ